MLLLVGWNEELSLAWTAFCFASMTHVYHSYLGTGFIFWSISLACCVGSSQAKQTQSLELWAGCFCTKCSQTAERRTAASLTQVLCFVTAHWGCANIARFMPPKKKKKKDEEEGEWQFVFNIKWKNVHTCLADVSLNTLLSAQSSFIRCLNVFIYWEQLNEMSPVTWCHITPPLALEWSCSAWKENLRQIVIVYCRSVDSTTTLDADFVHYSHFHAPLFSRCHAVWEEQPSMSLDLLPFFLSS